MKTTTRAGLALALAAMALPALAQENELRPYVTGGYQYLFEDDSRNSDNGEGYFFGAGKALNQYWGVEFGGFYDQFDREPGQANNWHEYGGRLDALFFYSRDRRLSPYVNLGVGGARTVLKNIAGESTDPFVTAGVGFFKYFDVGSGDIGMRADVNYRWLDIDQPGIGAFEEPVVRVGLVMALGDKPMSSGVVDLGPDSDGDGVLDDADLCPATAKGAKVDAKGCPVDSDGDGIADDLDSCPNTARGLGVDAKGCPTDGSGRFKVVGQGAELRFDDVHFEFDQSSLTDHAQSILDNAAKTVNGLTEKFPSLKVDISGHADATGTDGYNQALSERRANAVKQYLIRKGVEAGRVSTYAYGESKPVATNDSEEGRAQNRRAEIRTRGE